MNKLLSLLEYPPLRVGVALGYTLFVIVILVQPTNRPVVDLHLSTETPSLISQLWFGVGHTLLFAVMALLWCWSFMVRLPLRAAVLMAFCVTLLVGGGTEFGQFIVSSRDPSLFDLAADTVGALLPLAVLWIASHGRQDSLVRIL